MKRRRSKGDLLKQEEEEEGEEAEQKQRQLENKKKSKVDQEREKEEKEKEEHAPHYNRAKEESSSLNRPHQHQTEAAPPTLKVGHQAPDFEAEGVAGSSFVSCRLSQFRGTFLLVNYEVVV